MCTFTPSFVAGSHPCVGAETGAGGSAARPGVAYRGGGRAQHPDDDREEKAAHQHPGPRGTVRDHSTSYHPYIPGSSVIQSCVYSVQKHGWPLKWKSKKSEKSRGGFWWKCQGKVREIENNDHLYILYKRDLTNICPQIYTLSHFLAL